jgi:mRNA-degrading endonuclease YafQ of YafQ-DinJ toxin-antitoxin module
LKRLLLPTKAFERSAKRLVGKDPGCAKDLQATLELLAEDAFHPALKTHKLKGQLAGSWACSAGYNLRLVFQFVAYKGSEAILLEGAGTHDEVY